VKHIFLIAALVLALPAGALEITCVAPETVHGTSEDFRWLAEVSEGGTVVTPVAVSAALYVNGVASASSVVSATNIAGATGLVQVHIVIPPEASGDVAVGDVCSLVLEATAGAATRRTPIDGWVSERVRAR
jgi:hypothetical protein